MDVRMLTMKLTMKLIVVGILFQLGTATVTLEPNGLKSIGHPPIDASQTDTESGGAVLVRDQSLNTRGIVIGFQYFSKTLDPVTFIIGQGKGAAGGLNMTILYTKKYTPKSTGNQTVGFFDKSTADAYKLSPTKYMAFHFTGQNPIPYNNNPGCGNYNHHRLQNHATPITVGESLLFASVRKDCRQHSLKVLIATTRSGHACTTTLACKEEAAKCEKDICWCGTTHYDKNGYCEPRLGTKKSCNTKYVDQCVDNATCRSFRCHCVPDYREDNSTCVPKSVMGEQCTQTSDCNVKPVASCVNGTCTCSSKAKLYEDGLKCSLKKDLGGDCNSTIQCKESAACRDGQCACGDGYYKAGSSCRAQEQIGSPCADVSYCADPNAICLNKKCKCNTTTHFENKNKACVLKKGLDASCAKTEECEENAVCEAKTNMCTCGPNTYRDGNECKEGKALGDACSNSEECSKNAECENKTSTCTCESTHYQAGTKCAAKKALKAACSNTTECAGDNVECSGSKCGCSSGNHNVGGKCVKLPIPMTAGDDSVSFMCSTNTSNTPGKIVVSLNLKAKAVALYARNMKTTCGTGANDSIIADTTDTSAPFRYTFEIDAADATHKAACGIQDGTENASDRTSMVFFVIKVSGNKDIIIRGDGLYMMKCNWNTDNHKRTVTAATKITGTIDPYLANKGILDAVLEIFSDNQGSGTQKKKTTVTLSDSCSIRITFNNVDKKLVKRGKITDVMANHMNDFSKTPLLLFGSDGCGKAASGVVQATHKFSPETTFNAANPSKFQYKSDDFSCFKFITGNDMYYKATVMGCIDANDPLCASPSCSGSKKKRSVDPLFANRTDELIAMVTVVDELSTDLKSTQDSNLDAVQGMEECLNNVSYLAVIVVLSVLLLLSLLMTIIFCVKLTRGQTPPIKEGYSNHAYRT